LNKKRNSKSLEISQKTKMDAFFGQPQTAAADDDVTGFAIDGSALDS
jgi:hypothetical protein